MTPREQAAFAAGIEAARQMALTAAVTLERTYRAEYAPSSARGVQTIHPAANSSSAAILRKAAS